MKQILKKHPLAIRWFHWLNFPILGLMIWSGLMIYWANGVYQIGWGSTTILKFFPKSFYEAFSLKSKLADGMSLHFIFMWIFALNGFLYVIYTFFSGEWRYLIPKKNALKEAWSVVLYDLRLSKIEPPVQKYNAAQQIAYSMVIVMGLGSLLTGVAIYKPIQFATLCWLMGGYAFARIIHFALTIGYVLFFVIHILQVIKAGWNNLQAMITGFEVKNP
jgi:thiosulfate reductase cytochrome b subunit